MFEISYFLIDAYIRVRGVEPPRSAYALPGRVGLGAGCVGGVVIVSAVSVPSGCFVRGLESRTNCFFVAYKLKTHFSADYCVVASKLTSHLFPKVSVLKMGFQVNGNSILCCSVTYKRKIHF